MSKHMSNKTGCPEESHGDSIGVDGLVSRNASLARSDRGSKVRGGIAKTKFRSRAYTNPCWKEGPMGTSILFYEIEKLRHRWGWFLALGIVMVLLGTVALIVTPAATIGTVIVLGWLLVFSGVMEAICAFRFRGWGGIFLHLIAGILGVFVGLLVVTH